MLPTAAQSEAEPAREGEAVASPASIAGPSTPASDEPSGRGSQPATGPGPAPRPDRSRSERAPAAGDPAAGGALARPVACRSFQRPCRARQKGHEGCLCNSAACQKQCCRASRLDPEARFIHYEGGNGKAAPPDALGERRKEEEEKGGGRNVFGYRGVANRVLDDRWSVAWALSSDLFPANLDEASLFLQGLAWLALHLAWLKIGEWLDDAAIGFEACLKAIWALGALRMVDIRADKADSDFEVCLRRGYEGRGYPLCAHGYVMHSSGYDRGRHRTKWVCNQACRREPRREGEPVSPVEGCPYLDEAHPLGQVRNVALAFPNGSVLLAREIPFVWAAARAGRPATGGAISRRVATARWKPSG